MCYFITLCIPDSAVDYLKEQAQPEMSTWHCENRHIMTHAEASFSGYVLATSMCSCDLYDAPFNSRTEEDISKRLKKKYKKQGWSEAKIKRAIDDALAASKPQLRGLRADAREVIARVADAAKRINVFVHWYSGDQTTEKLLVNSGPIVSSADIRSGSYVMQPDTLVTVTGESFRYP